tara:strand:- start:1630 stop:1974 length:345 start_codon:yes stop_codon:yes gene_type:complete
MTPRQAIIEAAVIYCRRIKQNQLSRVDLDDLLQPDEHLLRIASVLLKADRIERGLAVGPGYSGPEVIEAWLDDEDAPPRRFSRLVASVNAELRRRIMPSMRTPPWCYLPGEGQP